ncbi:unnamed protein product [Parascedosporium putredinis]|uniref:Nephrocystin 3-like N-terminal domain-containing protein n=1 Tax=Parascedosporium putredinis TaxID=1442378 RepID=A0A9P1MCQ5_9PEZI|nr:unnamed protein product [Parascedosporium putredinis]CAI7997043.1 unnamed protein product [Parascedosporium putredinis]
MEPLTALGLAANIVQFVEFSTKLIRASKDIYDSASGVTEENRSLESVFEELQTLAFRLTPPTTGLQTDDERALSRLAAECRILSDQMLDLLRKIKPKDPESKRQSAWSAVKDKWNEKEKKELKQRLDNCRNQLELQLNFLMSSDTKTKLEALAKHASESVIKFDVLQKHIDGLRRGVAVTSISTEAQAQLRELLDLSEAVSTRIVQRRVLNALAFPDMRGRFEAVDVAHFKTFRWILEDEESEDEESEDEEDEALDSYPSSRSGLGLGDDEDGSRSERDSDPNLLADLDENGDGELQVDPTNAEGTRDGTSDLGETTGEKIEGVNPQVEEQKSVDEERHIQEEVDESVESRIYKVAPGAARDQLAWARNLLSNWLTCGTGVFHISGKMGSGKSTLMKFLCDHPQTKTKLEKWAGIQKLVLAKFFFWKPGTRLQKSLSGLFRSLLHDVLSSCPELIPIILPKEWHMALEMPWQSQGTIEFSDATIQRAFTLIAKESRYQDRCFCFFIDGLDEYEETHQEDYRAMIELLSSWTRVAPNNIKLCVSSREYNVFLNFFPPDQRLRLQDLTRGDITRYIHDKLQDIDDESDKSCLVEAIMEKANGIFLWVALVVRSLRDRLEQTRDITILKKEIEPLPDELEGLFCFLLNSLSKAARTTAYQTFAMLDVATTPVRLSLFAYSFLEDYIRNSKFAIETPFQYEALDDTQRADRIARGRKNLYGCSRGLVEASADVVGYAHRSIPDF